VGASGYLPPGADAYGHLSSMPSLDNLIAAEFNQRSLVLGHHTTAAFTMKTPMRNYASWSAPRTPVVPEISPKVAFQKLFGTGTTTGTPGAPVDTTESMKKRSVLDLAAKELTRVKALLPVADRYILEGHADKLRTLELQLSEIGTVRPTTCSPAVANLDGWDPAASINFPRMARAMTDVAVQAMACNLRRSSLLQFGNGDCGFLFPTWPAEGININDRIHFIAHDLYNIGAVAPRMALENFMFRLYAELLTKMDAVKEGTGTLLDNSVVLIHRGMGRAHEKTERYSLIAGKAGGKLRGGKYYSFAGRYDNDLLVTCAQLVGATGVTTVGTPSRVKGPLPIS
jgi:hypothetical protein